MCNDDTLISFWILPCVHTIPTETQNTFHIPFLYVQHSTVRSRSFYSNSFKLNLKRENRGRLAKIPSGKYETSYFIHPLP